MEGKEKILCCSCGRTLANNMEYQCDNCNAGCHKNCVGFTTRGYGE